MIVDMILDRKYGCVPYDAARSMKYMYDEATIFGMTELARALDGGTEEDVKRELCNYIDNEGYRPSIKTYINRHNWTGERRRRADGRRAA